MCKLTETEVEQFLKKELTEDKSKEVRDIIMNNPDCKRIVEKVRKRIKKEEAKNKMLPHSKAKVDMFSAYLGRYLSILTRVSYVEQINIFDMFCGRGFYENGGEGSPIRSFKEIINVQQELVNQKKFLTKITLTLNDENRDFVEAIEKYISQKNKPEIHKAYPTFLNLKVKELFPKIISDLDNQKGKQKNLIFIDPYGYKEIHKKDIEDLLKNGNTEIILFLPISLMNRFKEHALKDDANESHQRLKEFIEEFFEKSNPIISGEKKVSVYEFIDFIKEALTFNSDYFSTSYFIERDNNNVYALFFVTPNTIGFEKILESKWELDKLQGNGFRLSNPGDFFKKAHINTFEIKLEQFLKSGIRNNIEVYEFALLNEHLKTHVGNIFRNWKKLKRLEVCDIITNARVSQGWFIEGKNLKVYYKLN